MTEHRLGATPDEWQHLDLILGLGADLLPVVQNTKATISPNSSISEIGKVPSKYNHRGEVSGFPAWAAYQATCAELAAWAAQADYGACIITRDARAIDVDATDPVLAARVLAFIAAHLGQNLPRRYRDNSAKFLHLVRFPCTAGKWVVHIGEKQQIEFLMDGRHFVAVGTHASGARIQWEGGLPAAIPEITEAEFIGLFDALQDAFGICPPTKSDGTGTRKKGAALENITDPVGAFLSEKGLALGTRGDGVIVACPWESEHGHNTTGSDTTLYFPAGSNGYPDPRFKCLHTACDNRTLQGFYDAIGYAPDTDVVCAEFDDGQLPANPLPSFQRINGDQIKASKDNVVVALARPDVCGFQIRHDAFKGETMMAPRGTEGWRRLGDTDYTELCLRLERGKFLNISKDLIRDSVAYVAGANQFDSAAHWLGGLRWDGVPRVRGFLTQYLGAAATPYTRAVGEYIWTAMAGRVLQPGCKADMVPVLVGAQGVRKTSAVAALVPAADFFTSLDLSLKDDDQTRIMRGKLVIELGELRGLATRDSEHIKAFITRTHEEWVPKYLELPVRYPRRCVFVGTSNKDDFLADETGERRWLPFHCGQCDPDAITRDRDQLWAEARELFMAQGVMFREAERLAGAEHGEFTASDSWENDVLAWLHHPDFDGVLPCSEPHLTAGRVLTEALGVPVSQHSPSHQSRLKKVLIGLGYRYVNNRVNGVKSRRYEAPQLF